MGTLILLVLMAGLAVVPWSIARHHWFPEWQETTRGIACVVLACLLPWYAVFLVVGGADWLVPLSMAVFIAVFMTAVWQRTQAPRRRR